MFSYEVNGMGQFKASLATAWWPWDGGPSLLRAGQSTVQTAWLVRGGSVPLTTHSSARQHGHAWVSTVNYFFS